MSDQSRVEQLLRNALGEDLYEVTPQSRVEELLVQLNELIEGISASVDPEELTPIVTAWLSENIHDGAVVDTSLSVAGAAAESKKTGEEISQLKEEFTEMYDPTPIYTLVDSSLITEKMDTFLLGGVERSNVNWRTMTLAVSGGDEYRINARYYSSIKCVTFFGTNDAYISEEGASPDDTMHTITVTVPSNAVKMSINDKKSSLFGVEKISYVLKEDLLYVGGKPISILSKYTNILGTEIARDVWNIGKHKFENVINLHGSNNGSFTYRNINYNGASFKVETDDIAPINTDCGYIGANHGYYYGYKATLNNHGLTVADIGKTCVISGDTWVLVQVLSLVQFVVVCMDSSTWYGAKVPSTVPTTFNFGTSITVTSIERDQIIPSVKNVSVDVAENSYEAFTIVESYDVINLKLGISAIINNVGNNNNSSIAELASDTVLTVRNVYTFYDNGSCAIIQNLKINNEELILNCYGGTQSNGISDADYFAVPLTQNDMLQKITASVDFVRNGWNDQTKPPVIYLQANGTGASSDKMFLQGIEMVDRNATINSYAGFVYTTMKMYPFAVQPARMLQKDTTYNLVSYRIPMYAYDIDPDVKFCGYCKVVNSYYFFCYNPTAVSKTISTPLELSGLSIETVIAQNATCLNSIVSTGIDVKINSEGYLLLKLS